MKLLYWFSSLAAVVAIQGNSLLASENIGVLLEQVKKSYDQEKYATAYETLVEASIGIFEKMPLKLNNFILVEEPASGYGVYTPRDSNVYKAEEPIYIYCEPKGYIFKKNNNQYKFGLMTDMSITNLEGHVLGGQNDFGKFEFISYKPTVEFILNLTYSLSGLEPGNYKIHTTARDLNSDKHSTETIEIRIEG